MQPGDRSLTTIDHRNGMTNESTADDEKRHSRGPACDVPPDPQVVEDELVALGPDVLAAKRRAREIARDVGASIEDPATLGDWRDRLKAYANLPAGEFDAIIKQEANRLKEEREAVAAESRREQHQAQRAEAIAAGTMLPSPANPMAVARRLIERRRHTDGIPHDAAWRGDYYIWTGTHWRREETSSVRGWLYQQTEHATYDAGEIKGIVAWQPNPNSINGVLDALTTGVIQRYSQLDPDRVVACTNGVLDLRTRELRPHSPTRFNLNALPYAYDPNATCPTWIRFLNEVLPPKDGVPPEQQGQQFLREWFGYVLSGRTDLQKIPSLVGPPRCGKGTVARVLEALLGKDAVTAPTLTKMAGPFGEESFIGKSLAILGDIRWNSRHVAEAVPIFLGISGEDWQTVARKNKQAWEGKLDVRFLLMSNDPPTFTDASGALGVRMIHLEFSTSFAGREDPDLTKKLLRELPGILNWALDGLDALTERGRFVPPANDTDLAEQVARLSSPETAFVQDCCFLSADQRIKLDDLFKAFKTWCDEEGKDFTPTKEVFSRNLQSAFRGQLHSGRINEPTVSGPRKKTTYIYGIRLAGPDDPAPAPRSWDRVNPGGTGLGQDAGRDRSPSDLRGQAETGSCGTETAIGNDKEKRVYGELANTTQRISLFHTRIEQEAYKSQTLANPVLAGQETNGTCPNPVPSPTAVLSNPVPSPTHPTWDGFDRDAPCETCGWDLDSAGHAANCGPGT